ncbi:MAG: glycosyltransferase [Pseudomonadales bacterium]|nr:glycosyltransferase [Pseudomonadales bacterium]
MTTLSVSIVTYDVARELFVSVLGALLVAVNEAVSRDLITAHSVVILDNGDDCDFLRRVVKQFDTLQCHIIDNPKNTGFASGHNRALQHCDADIHLILNPDALLAPNALFVGLSHLESNPGTVLISPYAEDPDGSQAYLCKRYPSVLDLFIRGFLPAPLRRRAATRLARYECQDFSTTEVTKGVPLVSGCCMLLRSSAIRSIDGFNEHYFLYFEDFELSLKIAALGSVDYLPAMRIVHHGGMVSRKGLRHIGMFCKSAFTFFKHNGWKLT